jgi:AAA+ ATPase superfamily predicted ATPase
MVQAPFHQTEIADLGAEIQRLSTGGEHSGERHTLDAEIEVLEDQFREIEKEAAKYESSIRRRSNRPSGSRSSP